MLKELILMIQYLEIKSVSYLKYIYILKYLPSHRKQTNFITTTCFILCLFMVAYNIIGHDERGILTLFFIVLKMTDHFIIPLTQKC